MKVILNLFAITLVACLQLQAQASFEPYWKSMAPFENPVGIVKAPGFDSDFFIVEQRGNVYRLEDNRASVKRSLFLDLTALVSQQGFETGLLGLAFHPKFSENRKFYVSYSKGQSKELVSHIVEMQLSDLSKWKVDPTKNRELISVSQPWENHNGGSILFGPDGYLYISWGDGGSGGDPNNNGQNLNVLLGKMLRIDVDRQEKGLPYAIPTDNPFRNNPKARPEIFAYGLRNVWQMQFDSKTGKLWGGDVGQNAVEEIDIIESGKNYGWRYYEAETVFKPTDPKPSNATPPVVSYSQKYGDKSVTGGFVYHGPITEWNDGYLYGDFITGRIWIFHPT
ncbi:MAG TPA: PQQ-dependent sugar dehydrogenase, partial [Catalimonadaceae bacterium]|nr:PQQ-dependent sugar dehydrogenase [Catalimonadaceae bacterium]